MRIGLPLQRAPGTRRLRPTAASKPQPRPPACARHMGTGGVIITGDVGLRAIKVLGCQEIELAVYGLFQGLRRV